jgi:sodium transport system permease protein
VDFSQLKLVLDKDLQSVSSFGIANPERAVAGLSDMWRERDMSAFFTIFKKELIDTLRDRRTIIAMVVVPLLIFPLIIGVTTKISVSQSQKAQAKTLRVALIGNVDARFRENLSAREDIQIVDDVSEDSVRSFIQSERLDAAFVFAENFDAQQNKMQAGEIRFYFKSTDDDDIAKRRLLEFTGDFEEQLLNERLHQLQLDESVVDAVALMEIDIASMKEKLGKTIGGFLPYIFVIFCFIGAMYPAIDLGAGEKERGTIETLLTAPVSGIEILLGKFGVVVLTGIGSALVSIVGLYIGIRQAGEIPPEILEVILGILEFKSIVMLVSLLLPLTIFFAGILLTLSIFAKTFKEAQSIITPVNIIVILPVAIGLIPGITLNTTTAMIPILNVSLATKEIIAGTIQTGLLIEVYLSLVVLAGLSLFVSSKLFLRESVIFRN